MGLVTGGVGERAARLRGDRHGRDVDPIRRDEGRAEDLARPAVRIHEEERQRAVRFAAFTTCWRRRHPPLVVTTIAPAGTLAKSSGSQPLAREQRNPAADVAACRIDERVKLVRAAERGAVDLEHRAGQLAERRERFFRCLDREAQPAQLVGGPVDGRLVPGRADGADARVGIGDRLQGGKALVQPSCIGREIERRKLLDRHDAAPRHDRGLDRRRPRSRQAARGRGEGAPRRRGERPCASDSLGTARRSVRGPLPPLIRHSRGL